MPVKNGVEIAREIRADLSLRSTSILFMTATGDHSLESEAMKIAPVLEKPVETRDLLSRLAEAVRKSGTAVQVTDAKVFFCSDDGEYTRALPMGSWEIYPGPERILHTDAKQIKAVFVRCVGEALPALTLLNLFRARNGCDRIPVFIQPRTSGEERLLKALPDDNLTVIPRELSPSMLADKYLIPIG
jgi:DNA-binding response OmpR family regulator